MTLQQAINEGYQYYIYSNEGFQSINDLSDLQKDESPYAWEREMEIVENESFHPANTVDAKDILRLIGEQLQDEQSFESGDDTDNISNAIKSIDHSILKRLLDAIAEKLDGISYYISTGITLTKQ